MRRVQDFKKNKLCGKLKSSLGESITETLVSLLIISMAMAMLAGSIVSAAKVNKTVKGADTAFKTTYTDSTGTQQNNFVESSGSIAIGSSSVTVKIFKAQDDNKYVYYEPETAAATTP